MCTPSKYYSITVTIDDKTLESLKGLKRTLALVRDVDMDGRLRNGNIVLAAMEAKDLKTSQTFTWGDPYEVYATQVGFKADYQVNDTGSSHRAIQVGQKATINPNEVLVEGDINETKPITVLNSWKDNAHIVIGCKGSKDINTQFYIAPPTGLNDLRELTPVQSFFVFFDTASTEIQTMVDVQRKGVTGHFQFDGGTKGCTVSYTANGGDPAKYWTSQDAKKL